MTENVNIIDVGGLVFYGARNDVMFKRAAVVTAAALPVWFGCLNLAEYGLNHAVPANKFQNPMDAALEAGVLLLSYLTTAVAADLADRYLARR